MWLQTRLDPGEKSSRQKTTSQGRKPQLAAIRLGTRGTAPSTWVRLSPCYFSLSLPHARYYHLLFLHPLVGFQCISFTTSHAYPMHLYCWYMLIYCYTLYHIGYVHCFSPIICIFWDFFAWDPFVWGLSSLAYLGAVDPCFLPITGRVFVPPSHEPVVGLLHRIFLILFKCFYCFVFSL